MTQYFQYVYNSLNSCTGYQSEYTLYHEACWGFNVFPCSNFLTNNGTDLRLGPNDSLDK